MKFVLTSVTRYWWPVTVNVPDPSAPGKIVKQTFKMLFEPQDREEIQRETLAFAELNTEIERIAHENARLRKICKDWDDIEGESGSPVPFTDENFSAAIKQNLFRAAIYVALNESQNGEEARLGN